MPVALKTRADQHPAPGRHRPRHGDPARPDRAGHPPDDPRRSSPTTTTRSTSTRPASSCSAARTPTAASPAARSSSTPTAAWAATAAARSAARTRARSTARPPTPPAGWPSTSSPPAPPTRCEVQVAYAIGMAHPMSILVETFGTNTVDPDVIEKARARACSTCVPARDRPRPRPEAADLPRDRGLRPLRPVLPGFTVGADQPPRRLQGRRRRLTGGRRPRRLAGVGRPGRPRRHRARQGVRLPRPRRGSTAARSAPSCACRCTAGGSAAGWSPSTRPTAPSAPARLQPIAGGRRRSGPAPELDRARRVGVACAGRPGGCGRSSSPPARRRTSPGCRAGAARWPCRGRSPTTLAGLAARARADGVLRLPPAGDAVAGDRSPRAAHGPALVVDAVGRAGRGCWRRGAARAGACAWRWCRRSGRRGRRRRRRRDRRPRRGVGAVPRARRGGRGRRARRGAAGGARADVARPRRASSSGPGGPACRCCWCRRARR